MNARVVALLCALVALLSLASVPVAVRADDDGVDNDDDDADAMRSSSVASSSSRLPRVSLSKRVVDARAVHARVVATRANEANARLNSMYGADADLIHLGLATHETHFNIIREVVMQKAEKKADPFEADAPDEEEEEEEEEDAVVVKKPFQFINIGVQFAPREKCANLVGL